MFGGKGSVTALSKRLFIGHLSKMITERKTRILLHNLKKEKEPERRERLLYTEFGAPVLGFHPT